MLLLLSLPIRRFVDAGGWEILNIWLQEAKDNENHPFILELIKLFKVLPVSVEILKKVRTLNIHDVNESSLLQIWEYSSFKWLPKKAKTFVCKFIHKAQLFVDRREMHAFPRFFGYLAQIIDQATVWNYA